MSILARRAPIAAILLALSACQPGGRGSARPTPSPKGHSIGHLSQITLDENGGTLVSADSALTISVPAGALAGPTILTTDEITNTAPDGVGNAYRLGPEGTTFAVPVTLTFSLGPTPPAPAVTTLSAAFQEPGGFWLRQRGVTVDAVAQTLSVPTSHFSDWAVVASTGARDLSGSFTVTSTLDGVSLTAAGTASFDYTSEDPGASYYVQWGTITAASPVMAGADACAPDAPAIPITVNVADLTKAATPAFDWGVTGDWTLTCTPASGTPYASAVVLAFDTYGIYHGGCARAWSGTPVLTADQVAGTFTVDCGLQGQLTAAVNFCTGPGPCP